MKGSRATNCCKKKSALTPDEDFQGDFLEVEENIQGIANAASAVLN
jgi:hypothetical protein